MTPLIPPESDEDDGRRPVEEWMIVVAGGLVLACGAVYAMVLRVVPTFVELFAGFGGELPWLTQFVLTYHKYQLVLLVPVSVPFLVLVRNPIDYEANNRRRFRYVLVGFATTLMLYSLNLVAIYLPVFRLGTVI